MVQVFKKRKGLSKDEKVALGVLGTAVSAIGLAAVINQTKKKAEAEENELEDEKEEKEE